MAAEVGNLSYELAEQDTSLGQTAACQWDGPAHRGSGIKGAGQAWYIARAAS